MNTQFKSQTHNVKLAPCFILSILILTMITSCSVTQTLLPSPTTELIPVLVYFTDENLYAQGTPPFEVAVTRMVPAASNLPRVVLEQFFIGPTGEERQQGLVAITSGFNGISLLVIEDEIARVYLTGECASMGATYTIAQPLMKNLLQFPGVTFIKIYDQNGETEEPQGKSNSIPFCLEP